MIFVIFVIRSWLWFEAKPKYKRTLFILFNLIIKFPRCSSELYLFFKCYFTVMLTNKQVLERKNNKRIVMAPSNVPILH